MYILFLLIISSCSTYANQYEKNEENEKNYDPEQIQNLLLLNMKKSASYSEDDFLHELLKQSRYKDTRRNHWFQLEGRRVSNHPPPGQPIPKPEKPTRYSEHKEIRDKIAHAKDELAHSIQNILS